MSILKKKQKEIQKFLKHVAKKQKKNYNEVIKKNFKEIEKNIKKFSKKY